MASRPNTTNVVPLPTAAKKRVFSPFLTGAQLKERGIERILPEYEGAQIMRTPELLMMMVLLEAVDSDVRCITINKLSALADLGMPEAVALRRSLDMRGRN